MCRAYECVWHEEWTMENDGESMRADASREIGKRKMKERKKTAAYESHERQGETQAKRTAKNHSTACKAIAVRRGVSPTLSHKADGRST